MSTTLKTSIPRDLVQPEVGNSGGQERGGGDRPTLRMSVKTMNSIGFAHESADLIPTSSISAMSTSCFKEIHSTSMSIDGGSLWGFSQRKMSIANTTELRKASEREHIRKAVGCF